MRARTLSLTAIALLAFAANSLLCRLALRPNLIDAATFTSVRLASGTLVLLLLARGRGRAGGFPSALALAAYAIPFSFAYVRLAASTGALILFACVQLTMFGWSLARGEHPSRYEWLGLLLAAAGIIILNAPGLTAPDPIGAALMAAAGVAWGAYTIRGRSKGGDPIAATRTNFLFATPLALAVLPISFAAGDVHASDSGLALAAASGSIASGLGYVVWYTALRGLSAAQAGVAQLSVPVIAAFGGVLFLDETVSARLAGAGALILSGVAVALFARYRTLSS